MVSFTLMVVFVLAFLFNVTLGYREYSWVFVIIAILSLIVSLVIGFTPPQTVYMAEVTDLEEVTEKGYKVVTIRKDGIHVLKKLEE